MKTLTTLLCVFWCSGLAMAQSAESCGDLSKSGAALPNPSTVITSAKFNAPLPAQGNAGAMPEHCELLGKMNERTGANGQRYAIKFHLRLPTAWNGKFFFEGGGGSNGNLGNALGNLQGQQRTNALSLGYAVVSQDSGHDNQVNNDAARNGNTTFGFDPQARLDFGYNSYDVVAQAAKALMGRYYGRAPERSYYVGCSEGGREAMMMSQRFPSYFDGILAGAPGFNLPKAAVFGHTVDAQALADVAKATGVYDRFAQPFLNKTFTDEDLDLAAQAIVSACDSLDGLNDGMIENFPACTASVVTPKLSAMACKGRQTIDVPVAASDHGPAENLRWREEFQRRNVVRRLGLGSRYWWKDRRVVQSRLAYLEDGRLRFCQQLRNHCGLGATAVSRSLHYTAHARSHVQFRSACEPPRCQSGSGCRQSGGEVGRVYAIGTRIHDGEFDRSCSVQESRRQDGHRARRQRSGVFHQGHYELVDGRESSQQWTR
jgi:hypothetical protein